MKNQKPKANIKLFFSSASFTTSKAPHKNPIFVKSLRLPTKENKNKPEIMLIMSVPINNELSVLRLRVFLFFEETCKPKFLFNFNCIRTTCELRTRNLLARSINQHVAEIFSAICYHSNEFCFEKYLYECMSRLMIHSIDKLDLLLIEFHVLHF